MVTGYAVAGLTVAILAVLSVIADRKLAAAARLPMQWSFTGKVTWKAPRWIALSFTPAVAAVVLFGVATLLLTVIPVDRSAGLTAIIVIAVAFCGAHLLHLWLLTKTDL